MKTAHYQPEHVLHPGASVFVSANAGAGKTSLLTNRVLSLLLHGVSPSKILCLTFTNAAAAEMANRIQKELGRWVMAEEGALQEALSKLLGHAPDPHVMARARSLFADVLESPEGVRIQTIHGFCQSLLRRFPLEAGVSPHFTVMDGRSEQELLQEARLRLFENSVHAEQELREALYFLAHSLSESTFTSLIQEIIGNKRRFQELLTPLHGVEVIIDRLYRALKLTKSTTFASLIEAGLEYDDKAIAKWRIIIKQYMDNEEQDKGNVLAEWFAQPQQREKHFSAYQSFFLTKSGSPRAKLYKKSTITDDALSALLKEEQERVFQVTEQVKALTVARNTSHVLHFAASLLGYYIALKNAQALMDYDDLIISACNLLKRSGIAPWVLFKLDGGIDHIMVDEAQDTSPEQWAIVEALTQEFFAGKGRAEQERSLFIVGDEKQSIYSFQGADPVALGKMQRYFAQRIEAAQKPLEHVELQLSYRSTPEVLQAVDSIFAQERARSGLTYGNETLAHIPTRSFPGLVEIWPLEKPQEQDSDITISAATLLARRMASTIRGWLDEGSALSSRGRAVQAGDIMILVRSRTNFVDRLVRALKKQGVPVAGHDRMALSDNLAVKDLMALGQCLLLPEDDLNLAALLKSPICNVNEEQLFTIAWDRGKRSLWERLQEIAPLDPVIQQAYTLLADLRGKADYISPFALYSYVLDTLGARRRITGRMGEEYNDPIDEFLGQALLYERTHLPSLQGFLHWLGASDSEIKRDMEQVTNAVRIMTVHGSKGLQAPIVMLPDTTEVPKPRHHLHWLEQGDIHLPLWSASSQEDDPVCAQLRGEEYGAMLAEYRRLLYVALTRAEDRLYIAGATGKETLNEQSWYQLVREGLLPIATTFETSAGEGLRLGTAPAIHAAETVIPRSDLPALGDRFAFLTQPVPIEPALPEPLSPSHLKTEEPAAASPLDERTLFQRGTLIHRLLQYLPSITPHDRLSTAQHLAQSCKGSLSPEEIRHSIHEVLHLLEHPEFAFLFAEDTFAEVPVAGCVEVGGKTVAVAGQIDRLCMRGNEVWVVDFKSNRSAPPVVPATYLQQMRLYSLLMQRIYPGKKVHCALLWTASARMSIISDAQLDETAIPT